VIFFNSNSRLGRRPHWSLQATVIRPDCNRFYLYVMVYTDCPSDILLRDFLTKFVCLDLCHFDNGWTLYSSRLWHLLRIVCRIIVPYNLGHNRCHNGSDFKSDSGHFSASWSIYSVGFNQLAHGLILGHCHVIITLC